MFEKIKYHLSRFFCARQVRIGGIAILTAVTVVSVTLLNHSIKTVNIFDGENKFTVYSVDMNIPRVLSGLNLKTDRYQVTKTSIGLHTANVEIRYAFPVYITVGDETKTLNFFEGTVQDALLQAGITPDENDLVEPALDSKVSKTTYIDYADVEYVNGSYTEKIPFKTETVYDAGKNEGYTSQTKGSAGLREISYTEKYVNGTLAEKNITGKKVVKKAVNAVKTVGTKKVTPVVTVAAKQTVKADNTAKNAKAVTTSASVKGISTLTPSKPIELDANGIPVHYKSKMISRATAYTYTGHNCSTGVAPQPGYIAVNPKVIPYGTKMYIRTENGSFIYGYAVAADTGGFIRNHPTGVDLFMATESACCSFGVRNVEIYILE